MSWVAAAVIGGSVIGSISSNRAAGKQQDAANSANALQQYQYDQTREDQAPWRAAGQQSLDKLMGILSDGKYSTAQFTPQDLQNDPGYKFQQEQGMRGINSMADSFGVGGDTLKAASRFNEGLAGTYYNDAFNRFQTERNNTLNPLFKAAGFGSEANQQMRSAGQNYANQVGGNMMDAANVQANNIANQGNIYSNLINNGVAKWTRGQNPLTPDYYSGLGGGAENYNYGGGF
jgi:hypothetical protein